MIKLVIFLIMSLIICKPINSQTKEIVASFGGSLPPWVFEAGPSGILVDLLKDCLEPSGYIVKARLHPYARRLSEYIDGKIDVVSDINQKVIDDRGLNGFYTGNIYAYENFLYSLSEKKFVINKIEELSNYSLLSWQGAIAHIGGKYAAMAKQNIKYSETHNQKTQLRLLFSNRVDFIQMDGNIYEFYRQEMLKDKELDVTIPVDKLPLFGKSPNGFLFRTEKARDACISNLGLVKGKDKYKHTLYFGQ